MGAAIGVIAASVMIAIDLAGLKTLMAGTREPYVALFLFYAFNMLTFGSAAMGAGVMRLPFDDNSQTPPKPHEEEPPLR
jgi:hypothetical protein